MKQKRPRLKRNQPIEPVSKIPSSQRPAPEAFPILVPIGDPPAFFPGELLDNERCIAAHGRVLANMAERGGFSPWEILENLGQTDVRGLPRAEADRLVAKRIAEWWTLQR